MARHPRWIRRVFSDDDLEAVRVAIARTETKTSAEVRVHFEPRVPRAASGDALLRARQVFTQLGMHQTARRSGVLIYLALAEHRVAIVGDEGIHGRVGDAYWAALCDHMIARLREGHLREGVVQAIGEVGEALRAHFPRDPRDTDELSDEVSLGEP
jgi:uncharacterized membrane protein